MRNGGAPDNAFAEGGAGGMGMGDENCLIQINGGYTVLDAQGDGVDSNGSVEIAGGVLLVCGPTSNGDGAFDYDLTATVTGGTVLMVGSNGMAQNFTSGEQPFAFATVSGSAGQNVAVVDSDGTVVASFTAAKQFGMVLATSPAFVEGGTYSLVIGGTVTGANADGYTDSGTVEGGSAPPRSPRQPPHPAAWAASAQEAAVCPPAKAATSSAACEAARVAASAAERRRSQHPFQRRPRRSVVEVAVFGARSSVCLLDSGTNLRVWHRFCSKSKAVNRKQ